MSFAGSPPEKRLPREINLEMPSTAFRDGVYAAELLAVAVTSLDFFSWLAGRPADAATVCASFGLTERVADVMLTLFSAMGLIESRDGLFSVAAQAPEFLEKQSFWMRDKASLSERPVNKIILEVIETGKPAAWATDTEPWAQMMEQEGFAEKFTRTMDARGSYLGPALAARLDLGSYTRLLDVAGGSGIYACCVLDDHPHLSATVFEKPPVDRIALARLEERGYSARITVTAGDMFKEPLPEGYDLHLWSNALHDWDVPVVKQLLRKSFDALIPGGMIVVHDAHLDREKNGPLAVAQYSVFLMASTDGRCYSKGEIEEFLLAANFTSVNDFPSAGIHSAITALKPAND